MRLWSIHPSHLDSKGLVALWREALLAQAVLAGKTKGYRRHPQLDRFRSCAEPLIAIADYLEGICKEAEARGYNFNRSKIGTTGGRTRISVTTGQLEFEVRHLSAKLQLRDPDAFDRLKNVDRVRAHPVFALEDGPIEEFERGNIQPPSNANGESGE